MKLKHLFLTLLVFVFIFANSVIGQDSNKELEDIQQFKDKLASKVAELQKKEDKAQAGFLLEIKSKSLKIETSDKEELLVELDELLTKYYSVSTSTLNEITKEKLEIGDYIIVTGPLNGKVISANNIYLDENFTSGSGIVNDTGQGDFSLSIVTLENETITIDIESSSKRKILNIKTLELEDVGFSKIKSGDVVHFFYKKLNNKEEKRYSATKILVIPQEYFSK